MYIRYIVLCVQLYSCNVQLYVDAWTGSACNAMHGQGSACNMGSTGIILTQMYGPVCADITIGRSVVDWEGVASSVDRSPDLTCEGRWAAGTASCMYCQSDRGT